MSQLLHPQYLPDSIDYSNTPIQQRHDGSSLPRPPVRGHRLWRRTQSYSRRKSPDIEQVYPEPPRLVTGRRQACPTSISIPFPWNLKTRITWVKPAQVQYTKKHQACQVRATQAGTRASFTNDSSTTRSRRNGFKRNDETWWRWAISSLLIFQTL